MGNAEFQSMAVRGFFRAAEYQINRIALSEGDVFHTENGLVKSAEQQRDGRWRVVLQERFQGDVTGFRAGDILRGAYNSVGTSGGAAEIRTSWLRVEAVDAQAGTLTASLYADNQTPEGRNAPPVPLMRLARWGNTTDPERQSHIVESATDGRIVRRVKVSAPIVDGTQSDGFVVGKLPAWLREHFGAAVAGASDYVFARGIITQNILRYTPAGRPLAERVDRGLWSASSRYFYEQQNPQTGAFEISRVWHEGALYELARGGNGKTAPAANSTHWTLIQAKPKDGKDGGNYKTNLIDNSSFQEGIKGWDSEQIKGVFEDGLFSPVVGTRAIKFEVKSLREHDYAGISQKLSSYDLPPNTICTLSVWVRATSDLRQAAIIVAPNLESRPWAGKDIVKGQEGWQRNVLKFTTPRDVGGKPVRVYMLLYNQEENATVWFAAPKLEIGDTPTEWTTSENDRKGTPGKSNYTHIAYSQHSDGSELTFSPANALYIGLYTDENPAASSDPARYIWTQFRGDKGSTTYLHIAHANGLGDEFKDFTTSNPDGRKFVYMGTCVDENSPDPTDPNAYQWTKVEGEQGAPGDPGKNGLTSHTHTAYANSADGQVDFTTTPGGAAFDYIGIYTDFEEKASDDRRRYAWAKVKGKQGNPGDKGDPGRGIDRIETFYLLTADGTAPEDGARDWRNTPPVPTPQKPWLWTYERVVYSDGKNERTKVRLVTRLAKDGAEAQPTRPNLLDGTDFHQDGAWESGLNGTHAKTETAKDVQPAVTGCGVLRTLVERGAVGEEYAQFSQRIPVDLVAGLDYTFSVYVRGDNTGWMIVFPNSGEHFRLSAAKPGEWQRVSVSFKARTPRPGEENRAYLRCWLKNADNTQRHEVLFCAPKLEEGLTATPWCLSENDKVGATVQYRGFWDAFADGTVFHGRNETGGGYEDVVTILTPAGTQETYRCTRTHTKAGNDTRPGANSPYWKKGDSFELVSTGILLAGTAQIGKIATGNISQDRMVTAGAEMRFYAAGCKHPGLVFGYRSDTQKRRFPVLQCFDPETGALLYDLGPEGIFANARRVAGVWTPLQMIRVTRFTTITQLYKWLMKDVDNWNDQDIEELKVESPFFADNGARHPLYWFGHGAYYAEGWSEFRRADGTMHKIFESSRTSTPTEDYPAAFWFNPFKNQMNTTAPPENALTDDTGAAIGDINATRVEDGWYCSRVCPIRVEKGDFKINVNKRPRTVTLYAIDLWRFRGGKKIETGTTYFIDFDLEYMAETDDAGRAFKGRNSHGLIEEDSRNSLIHVPIFEIQGFDSRRDTSIKPQKD
nr:MAG TPA: tail protein [Caudoviricetes sp.]